ncbi:MAG TPA: Ig-like domain-containing protein [Puia sp.]|nr:Ig-like domain-containing protein [Puia sp.]
MNRLLSYCLYFLLPGLLSCHKNDPPAPASIPSVPQTPVVHVTGLAATPLSLLLFPDSSFKLATVITPANATNAKVLFSSSNTSVVKVDSTGRITGISLGTATVTAASSDIPSLAVTIQVAVVKQYKIYIAGYSPTLDYSQQPFVWVNGTATFLSPGYTSYNAQCLALSGTDVFIGGTTINRNNWEVASYWKNGIPVQVSDPANDFQSYTTAIAVSGGDIFVASYAVREQACPNCNGPIWNAYYYRIGSGGTSRVLLNTDTNRISTVAYGMAISGNDVYIAGALQSDNFYRVATYWKNDVNGAVALTPGGSWAEATAIGVQGGDVYVAGYDGCPNFGCLRTAKLWKNDMHGFVNLTGGATDAYASCLTTSDTAQYVGGFEVNAAGLKVAKFWKVRGSSVTPIVLTDGTTDAAVNAITASGNDIFLAGYQVDPISKIRIATYWRVYGNIVSTVKVYAYMYQANFAAEANAILIK